MFILPTEAEEKKTKTYGKAALGGPFSLIDHNGERKQHSDFLGKWVLLYFGFTFCPDICPEELEKMTEAIEILGECLNFSFAKNMLHSMHSLSHAQTHYVLSEQTPGLPNLQPLFITVDPKRDSPEIIKTYLKGLENTALIFQTNTPLPPLNLHLSQSSTPDCLV